MTAKIFEYSPESIAKVYNPSFPLDYIEYEKSLLRIVSDLDIKLAKYIDFKLIDNQPAMIMERIDGRSLLAEVLRRPLSISAVLDSFIEAQREIHSKHTDQLPNEKTRFRGQLSRSGLDQSTREKIESLVDQLPDGNSVCHGDFHFGNIISTPNGLYTIDWMNSYGGNPIGDIFRSYLMLKSPFNPLPIRGIRKFLFMTFKAIVAGLYIRKSLRATRLMKGEKSVWLTIMAAVRLCDNVPDEREWLERLIARNLPLRMRLE